MYTYVALSQKSSSHCRNCHVIATYCHPYGCHRRNRPRNLWLQCLERQRAKEARDMERKEYLLGKAGFAVAARNGSNVNQVGIKWVIKVFFIIRSYRTSVV